VLPKGVFLVAEQRGTLTFGNTQTGSIFLSYAPDFRKEAPRIRSVS
jgi:hypothetical protein